MMASPPVCPELTVRLCGESRLWDCDDCEFKIRDSSTGARYGRDATDVDCVAFN